MPLLQGLCNPLNVMLLQNDPEMKNTKGSDVAEHSRSHSSFPKMAMLLRHVYLWKANSCKRIAWVS